MKSMDRYILSLMLRPFFGVMITILAIMSLEHVPALLKIARSIDKQGMFLLESIVSLVPEYASIAMLVSLFLAIALTVRRLGLTSELDALSAAGASNWRILRWPLLFGLVVAAVILSIRCYIQPIGEQQLIAIGQQARSGEFGLGLKPREILHPTPDVTLSFDAVSAADGLLRNVFLQSGRETFTARRGTAKIGADNRLTLALIDGVLAGDNNETEVFGRGFKVIRFQSITISVPSGRSKTGRGNQADALASQTLSKLLVHARSPLHQKSRPSILSAIYERMGMGLFAAIMPVFGFVLGMPTRRGTSAFGIALGMLLIAIFIRASAAIQGQQTIGPALAIGLFMLCWAMVAGALFRLHITCGAGFIERGCARLVDPLRPIFLSLTTMAIRVRT